VVQIRLRGLQPRTPADPQKMIGQEIIGRELEVTLSDLQL
jgi:hypothetical protein